MFVTFLVFIYFLTCYLFIFLTGKHYKYIDSKWQKIDYADSLKITKIEGQVR